MPTPVQTPVQTHVPTHIAPGFEELLAPRFLVAALDRDPAVVFGLHANLTLAYFNQAWSAFAGANGGQPGIAHRWGLDAHYLDAIPDPLRAFYAGLLARAPDPDTSMHPIRHEYECSSATLFRKLGMQVYALPERAGFVVVNSLVIEVPHDPVARPPQSPERARYVDARGLIVQCAHCRRVQRGTEPGAWDWVPSWVDRSPDMVTHGVCGLCLEYFFPVDGATAAAQEEWVRESRIASLR